MEEKKVDSIRWIRCMFYLNVAGLAISLLGFLPINNNWIAWPNRALTAASLKFIPTELSLRNLIKDSM